MTKIVAINQSAEMVKVIRKAINRWHSATEEWKVATLELAVVLWQARQQHPSNAAFGAWLGENELDDLTRNERAVLIAWGQHLQIARVVLDGTTSRSVEYIHREEVLPRIQAASSETSEDGATRSSDPETPETEPQSAPEAKAASSERKKKTAPAPKAFKGLERGDEMGEIFLDGHGRTTVSRAVRRKGGSVLWQDGLALLDVGLLKPTTTCSEIASYRMYFPDAPRNLWKTKDDLTTPKGREFFHDVIVPAALAYREQLLEDPTSLAKVVADYEREQRAQPRQSQPKESPPESVATGPQIVMYGVQMWPRPANELYSYAELRSAIWSFRDLLKHLDQKQSFASRCHVIRLLIVYFDEFVRHEIDGDARGKLEHFIGAIRTLTRLAEANPEGRCEYPTTRKREDEEW